MIHLFIWKYYSNQNITYLALFQHINATNQVNQNNIILCWFKTSM
jgi:hypothetical protein